MACCITSLRLKQSDDRRGATHRKTDHSLHGSGNSTPRSCIIKVVLKRALQRPALSLTCPFFWVADLRGARDPAAGNFSPPSLRMSWKPWPKVLIHSHWYSPLRRILFLYNYLIMSSVRGSSGKWGFLIYLFVYISYL